MLSLYLLIVTFGPHHIKLNGMVLCFHPVWQTGVHNFDSLYLVQTYFIAMQDQWIPGTSYL